MVLQEGQSPLGQVWRQFIPQEHDQSLQSAFYNVAAMVFVVLAGAAAFSVYLILQPFVQALLWAVLFGSVLHPVKHTFVEIVHQWLLSVKDGESPLSISFALLPVTFIDSLSELVGKYFMKHLRWLIAVTIILPSAFIVIHHTPAFFSQFVYSIAYLHYSFLQLLLSIINYCEYIGIALVAGYVISLFLYCNEDTKQTFKILSLPAWMLTVGLVAAQCSMFGVAIFFIFLIVFAGGIYVQAVEWRSSKLSSDTSLLAAIRAVILDECLDIQVSEKEHMELDEHAKDMAPTDLSSPEESENRKLESDDHVLLQDTVYTGPPPKRVSENEEMASAADSSNLKPSESSEEEDLASNFYLKTVFVACIIAQLWRNSLLLSLLPLTVLYYGVKKTTAHHFYGEGGLKEQANAYLESRWETFTLSFEEKKKLLFPAPVRGVWKLAKKFDHLVLKTLISSTDAVVTLLIMVVCMVLCVVLSIFFAVQIQGEGMQLITMGGQLLNATIVNNPQLKQMLPDDLNDVMGSTLDNAYLYGRDWLSNMVRDMLGETDPDKAATLEKQVIKLWDHVYQAWVVSHPQAPFTGPVVTSEAVSLSFDSLVDGVLKTPELISFAALSDMVKENIGTVMNVLDGIWSILMSNLSLALSAFTAVTSILLGGSLSILNALLNLVVFLSSLFYILSISGSVYKPVAVLSGLAPGQMNTLGTAVEESVNSVFTASFKMGAFYGMWTWLIHSLFATNIVYIPAVTAALLGAVPLLGTYWAVIPGAIELFWGHESPILALMLVVAQLLPLLCVDTAIYSEIKGGGHPYLTGLAVAGGIFCWGVEGAILGPLVLCILRVATKMYSSLMRPSENKRSKKLRR